MGIFSLNKHVALAVKAVCWLARLVRWRSFLRAKRRGRLSAICAGIGRRDRPVLKPARQRRCSAWMSRKCSGIGYGSSLFETFSGVSQRRNSALCLCQMRRKRLIRPTKAIISTGFVAQRIRQSCSQHIDGAFVFYFVNEAPFTI